MSPAAASAGLCVLSHRLFHFQDLCLALISATCFTEVNFALTVFIAVEFAPRIQSFQHQQLYSFAGMDVPNLTAYGLVPVKYIDRALMEAQWDTLLRLVVNLKQKHVTASTLLRRLNSYSQQYPVYLALRELGRVVRTEFVLRYMDDQRLRKRINDQLINSKVPTPSPEPCSTAKTARFPTLARKSSKWLMSASNWCKT